MVHVQQRRETAVAYQCKEHVGVLTNARCSSGVRYPVSTRTNRRCIADKVFCHTRKQHTELQTAGAGSFPNNFPLAFKSSLEQPNTNNSMLGKRRRQKRLRSRCRAHERTSSVPGSSFPEIISGIQFGSASDPSL